MRDYVTVAAIAPFWRYAVDPTSGHSPAIPFYTFKEATRLFNEVKQELPWAKVILYKRKGWSGIEVLAEYIPEKK